MNNQIGFVFDHNSPQNYNPQPMGYQQYPQAQLGLNSTMPSDYGNCPPPPPPLPYSNSEFPQGNLVPYQPAYPAYPGNEGNSFYGDHAQDFKHGGGYNPSQPLGTYDPGQMHVMTPAEIEADVYGNRRHGGGGGIPGGKFGVIGGAAAAGVGTGLAMQLLPKKLKKNKLVKYGLPLAGAGAAGYALNQINNGGKHKS